MCLEFPEIIIHFIAHVQINSHEPREAQGRQQKLNLCLYLDKFHCLLFFCSSRSWNNTKISMKNNLSINIWAHLTMELFSSIQRWWKEQKVKTREINKSSCDGSFFLLAFWVFGGKYQITLFSWDKKLTKSDYCLSVAKKLLNKP